MAYYFESRTGLTDYEERVRNYLEKKGLKLFGLDWSEKITYYSELGAVGLTRDSSSGNLLVDLASTTPKFLDDFIQNFPELNPFPKNGKRVVIR